MLCTTENLRYILSDLTDELRGICGENLENVILYGSYARGDADAESDIDIMILINGVPREELWRYEARISPVLSRIERVWNYEILLSVVLEDTATFEKYAAYMPFFRNVTKEGIGFVRERIN